jgi:hypothetical protein
MKRWQHCAYSQRRSTANGTIPSCLGLWELKLIPLFFDESLGENNDLAIVISTLLIAALFLPLRRVIQTAIDRRFFRRKYDAVKTLEAFSATLRDEVDLYSLTNRLLEVVEETVQPAQVSLWLAQTDRGTKR